MDGEQPRLWARILDFSSESEIREKSVGENPHVAFLRTILSRNENAFERGIVHGGQLRTCR